MTNLSDKPTISPRQDFRRSFALIWACTFISLFFIWFLAEPPPDLGYIITMISSAVGAVATILAYAWGKKL